MLKDKSAKNTTWLDQYFYGNPALEIPASMKYFPNPLNGNRLVPVWIWIYEGLKSTWMNYTISAGADSDFSMTGSLPDCPIDLEQAKQQIESLASQGKLFR